jgi:hypothetical protein
VADDRRRVRQHGVVGHPALDVHVRRQGAELAEVARLADRDEEAGAQRRQRVDRGAVESGVVRQVRSGRHRAERQVHERVEVAGPPVGQRRRGGGLLAGEAADVARARDGGVLERLGDHGEVRRVAQPVAGRVGGQAQRSASAVDLRRRLADGQLLDGGEPETDAHERDAVQLGDQGRGELPALADDDVGAPVLDDRPQAGQRRSNVDAGEEVADHPRLRRVDVQASELLQQRHPLLGRGVADRRERQAGALDVGPVLVLGGHEHLVPGAQAGVPERCQRQDVSGAAPGRHQDAHRPTLGGLAIMAPTVPRSREGTSQCTA